MCISDSNGTDELVIVGSTGNVGIGCTSPYAKLTVAGNITSTSSGEQNIVRNNLKLYYDVNNPATTPSNVASWGNTPAVCDIGPNQYVSTLVGNATIREKEGLRVWCGDGAADYLAVCCYNVSGTANTYEAWVKVNTVSGGYETIFDSGGTERPLLGFYNACITAYLSLIHI